MVDFPHKVSVPQQQEYLVARPHLHELLNSIDKKRLVTLVAPAGYGKTSLLVEWSHAHARPICWYGLDQFDQNPWVFLEYFAASIEQRFPGSTQHTTTLLASESHVPFATTVAALARDVYAIQEDVVLVLDNWHLVDDVPDIKMLIAYLLLRCTRCRFVVAARTYPSIPDITLLAAQRQLTSLNEAHLRFSAADAQRVLAAQDIDHIAPEQTAALTEELNGWITGILLSAQALESGVLATGTLRTLVEQQVYHFLVEQVFERQPADIQQFLLESALLEELTAEHCNAMLGRNDSRRLLAQLQRLHIFVREIEPGVLKYLPIFREFLHHYFATMQPEQYEAARLRLADVYTTQQRWFQAVEHYLAVNKPAAAHPAMIMGGQQLYRSGRLEPLEQWFSVMPPETLNVELLCLKARVLIKRGQQQQAQILAQQAEIKAQPNDMPLVLLLHAQLARVAGHYAPAQEIATRVLDMSADLAYRSEAKRTIAICHHRMGHLHDAITTFQEALALENERGDSYQIAQVQRDIGICYKEIGMLDVAEEYLTYATAYWEQIGNQGLRALSLNSKGSAQHLAGKYREAHATLETALQLAQTTAEPDKEALVLSSLGDVYNDLRLWQRASATYDAAQRTGGSAYVIRYVELQRIHLLVRQHQWGAAQHALQQIAETTRHLHPHSVELLHGLVALGMGSYDQACHHAVTVIADLSARGAHMDLARAYILRARSTAAAHPREIGTIIELLAQAAQVADTLGHDWFLVTELLSEQHLLQRVSEAAWPRARVWLDRCQDVHVASSILEHDDQRPVLTVRTLGTEQVLLNGQPVKLGWHKAYEVLYYLLDHPDGAPADVLAEAIWPNTAPERSRDTLRAAIYQLRSALPREFIALQGRRIYHIDREVIRVDYDAERFLHLVTSGGDTPELLTEAVSLYLGAYLQFTESEWCQATRTYIEQHFTQALSRAASGFEAKDTYTEALFLYRRMVARDSTDETAHAGAMRCYIALGNRSAAVQQYHDLRRTLDDELGLQPDTSSEVEHLYREILAAS